MDFTTEYLGLTLKSPLVPSASPLSRSISTARRLEDAGAGALIMYSLFEEAIAAEDEHLSHYLHHQETGFGEADSFLPTHHELPGVVEHYLENLQQLKEALDIPVIASLNGTTPSGWLTHAKAMEEAGADALELNVYFIETDIGMPGGQVDRRYLELLEQLVEQIKIPINMKLSPYFSSLGHMVKELEVVGARGVSLFNRFYQPDIDVDTLRLNHRLNLSNSNDGLLAMHWIGILYGRTELSLGATSGVHTPEDALRMLLAGADVVHLCSVLLEQGASALKRIELGIEEWMEEKGFESIEEFRGIVSQAHVGDPAGFERVNYIKSLESFVPKG
ncbi:MAG: dihydroorotate dehydrogenase-like protein [Sedimenticola sp.]